MTTATIEQLPEKIKDALISAYKIGESAMYFRDTAPERFNELLNRTIAALPLPVIPEQAEPVKEKRAPVQGFSAGIPWDMHLRAYDAYCKRYSKQQALIEGGCRGGFGTGELDMFIPGWREELSERTALLARIAELEAENQKLKEAVERADILAQAGLCQMSHGGTREFCKDIRTLAKETLGKE